MVKPHEMDMQEQKAAHNVGRGQEVKELQELRERSVQEVQELQSQLAEARWGVWFRELLPADKITEREHNKKGFCDLFFGRVFLPAVFISG